MVGLRQPLALAQHDLREGLDGGPVEAHDHSRWPEIRPGCGGLRAVTGRRGSGAEGGGLDADAGIGCEHDGRDEDEDADGDGYAVAEADAGSSYRRRFRRGHERRGSEWKSGS